MQNSKKTKVICKICNKEFFVFVSRIQRGQGKYCSLKCAYLGRRNRINATCNICGKIFETYSSWIKRRGGQFCSRKCKDEGQKLKLRGRELTKETKEKMRRTKLGNKNPAWEGGRTILKEKIRGTSNYRKWRMKVFARDNWTCQVCKKRGSIYLEAHHIISIVNLIIKNKIKTLTDAFNCSDLWNVENGTTLCCRCHSKHEHPSRNRKNGRFISKEDL